MMKNLSTPKLLLVLAGAILFVGIVPSTIISNSGADLSGPTFILWIIVGFLVVAAAYLKVRKVQNANSVARLRQASIHLRAGDDES